MIHCQIITSEQFALITEMMRPKTKICVAWYKQTGLRVYVWMRKKKPTNLHMSNNNWLQWIADFTHFTLLSVCHLKWLQKYLGLYDRIATTIISFPRSWWYDIQSLSWPGGLYSLAYQLCWVTKQMLPLEMALPKQKKKILQVIFLFKEGQTR